jgi:transposase
MSKKLAAALSGRQRKTIDDRDTLFVGVDVHLRTYAVSVWSARLGEVVDQWSQPSLPEQLHTRLSAYRARVERVVYEAGPTGFTLAHFLLERGWRVEVISATHSPAPLIGHKKNDRLDSAMLARWAASDMLHAVYIPTVEQLCDRQLLRGRERAVRKRARVKVQIKSLLNFHGIAQPPGLAYWSKAAVGVLARLAGGLDGPLGFCLRELLLELAEGNARVRRFDDWVRHLARLPRYDSQVGELCAVPGVGIITAMTFLTELIDAERFATRNQLGRFLGLSPDVRSSGETTRHCGRGLGGNKRLRTLLVEAAWCWVRRDARAQAKFDDIRSASGRKAVAIVAMARRLGIMLWRIWKSGHSYQAPPAAQVPAT